MIENNFDPFQFHKPEVEVETTAMDQWDNFMFYSIAILVMLLLTLSNIGLGYLLFYAFKVSFGF